MNSLPGRAWPTSVTSSCLHDSPFSLLLLLSLLFSTTAYATKEINIPCMHL